MHSEQYSSFLALSSSVSGLDGLLEAEALEAPGPACSEPLLLHPGEVEHGGGVGVGMRGHTEGTGESMGGVGGVVRVGRGPGARRGPFDCDRGCSSSTKIKKDENKHRENQRPLMVKGA